MKNHGFLENDHRFVAFPHKLSLQATKRNKQIQTDRYVIIMNLGYTLCIYIYKYNIIQYIYIYDVITHVCANVL